MAQYTTNGQDGEISTPISQEKLEESSQFLLQVESDLETVL